jgi:hypothetical protein
MRRVAAVLALVALSQSVLLRTGALCDALAMPRADAASAPAMPGMDMGGAPAPEHPGHPGTDRHHGDAHCPLIAACSAAALISIPVDVGPIALATRVVMPVRSDAPGFGRTAPEPPPPKN